MIPTEKTLGGIREEISAWHDARTRALRLATDGEDEPHVYMLDDPEVAGAVALSFDGVARGGGFTLAVAWPGLDGGESKESSITISSHIAKALIDRLVQGYEEATRGK